MTTRNEKIYRYNRLHRYDYAAGRCETEYRQDLRATPLTDLKEVAGSRLMLRRFIRQRTLA